ncbi:hypothetical protein CEP54_012461 [Fusarium duplospermum]|uniref:Uncharacterized protein n=1 Tax=Fusarium duplospermum TaxID=1325734 RepID=A0A428P8P9_9HYPO|nr:hypothetical protein CEP54_012461 [Fusarium duplospermum]
MYTSFVSPSTSQPSLDAGNSREKFIAIGIDFGTTFSGVSWVFSEQPDNIQQISEWPAANPSDSHEVQVPTTYDIGSGKWGYQVTRDLEPVKWFKLLLLNDEDMAREEIAQSKQLQEARNQLSKHHPPPTATEIVGWYLKELWDHTYDTLKSMIAIDDFPLRVAITIPAIWPHYAQNAMREAAKLAGITAERPMGAPTLDLVQEPEAASLSIMQERELLPKIKPGECFVVCDAGGGTVDVISYKVVLDKPFRLKECVKGDGGLFGAVRIDEAFEAHLWARDRLKIKSLDASEFNTLVVEDWERGVKRTFTNGNTPSEFSLRLPIKAFKTMDRLRSRDHFSLKRTDVSAFFNKSLTGIRTLVSNQCKQIQEETKMPPKNILLVGGLGSSRYIYGVLNDQFNGIVLRPRNGWSAVARGAVIRLLHDELSSQTTLSPNQQKALPMIPKIIARKSRYNYGITLDTEIGRLADYDKTQDKAFPSPAGSLVVRRMKWYLRKGEEVDEKSPVAVPFWRYYQAPLPKTCDVMIYFSPAESPPKRFDSTVQELCTIKCAFDTDFSQWVPVGDPDKGYRKCDNLRLMMKFNGEPSWVFRVGLQRAISNAQVQYM